MFNLIRNFTNLHEWRRLFLGCGNSASSFTCKTFIQCSEIIQFSFQNVSFKTSNTGKRMRVKTNAVFDEIKLQKCGLVKQVKIYSCLKWNFMFLWDLKYNFRYLTLKTALIMYFPDIVLCQCPQPCWALLLKPRRLSSLHLKEWKLRRNPQHLKAQETFISLICFASYVNLLKYFVSYECSLYGNLDQNWLNVLVH